MRASKTTREEAWLPVALSDTLALLADHAHCEKKAASSAMMLMTRHPDEPEIVAAMVELAREELAHFGEVHAALTQRGGVLGPDRGDPYVQGLLRHARNGAVAVQLIDRLLCAALVEARSFERLRLLGEHHPEPELAELFARFARSEARHGATFVSLARNVAARHGIERAEVDDRLEVLTRLEGELVESLPLRCAIH
ncbi:MAG: tRNA-(ms[2]io[6]A)-hydroxylase [Deltaproteobacteria bacterium]|nr:tRNA-(ms[2]io[6]A)-hydroxylase [Deltaproteobacteria bacterium]